MPADPNCYQTHRSLLKEGKIGEKEERGGEEKGEEVPWLER